MPNNSTQRLTIFWILTLDPERLENRKATIGQGNLSNGLDLRLTLKLLVTSHILRRSVPLSSKVST